MGQNEVKLIISGDASGALGALNKFSAQTEALTSKIKQHWLGLSVATAAAAATIYKAFDYINLGAKAQQAEESFHLVAKSFHEDANRIIEDMKRVSSNTVDDSDIMQKAVKGMIQGLKGDQLVKIMEAARISARVAGEDVGQAYETITDAIANNLPRALIRYGLITKEQMKIVNQAMQAGVTEIDVYTLAMANAEKQSAAFGKITSNTAEELQELNAIINNLKENLGVGLYRAIYVIGLAFMETARVLVAPFAFIEKGLNKLGLSGTYWQDTFSMQSKTADEWRAKMLGLGTAADKTGGDVAAADKKIADMMKRLKDAAGAEKAKKELQEIASAMADWKAKTDALNPSLDETTKEIMALWDEAEKLKRKFGDKEWISEGLKKGLEYLTDKQLSDRILKQRDSYLESMAAVGTAYEDATNLTRKWGETDLDYTKRAIDQKLKWAGLLETAKKQLEEEGLIGSAAYKAIEKALDDLTYKQQEYNAEASKTFTSGWQEGIDEYVKSLELGFERGKTLAREAAASMGNFFENVLTGKLKLSWESAMSWMWSMFAKLVAQMMTTQIMLNVGLNASGATGMLTGQGGGLGSYANMMGSSGLGGWINNAFGYTGGTAMGGLASVGYSSPIGPTMSGAPMGGDFGFGATPFGYIAAPLAGFGIGSMMQGMMGRTGIGGGIGGALGGLGGYALGAGGSLLGIQLGALGGPIGMLIGGLLGGVLGSLFGGKKEWTEPQAVMAFAPGRTSEGYEPGKDWQGLAGDVTGGGMIEFAWKNFEGAQLAEGMTKLFNATRDSLKEGFEKLGWDTDKFAKAWSAHINLAGMSAEEAEKAIKNMLGDYAKSLLPSGVDFEQFKKAGEEIGETVLRVLSAILSLPDAIKNIDEYISAIENNYDAIAKWREQMTSAQKNIDEIKKSLSTATDPADALDYANKLKQAVYEKYMAEKQMVEGLVAEIQKLEMGLFEFTFNMQSKIDGLTGSADAASIALDKMQYAMGKVEYYKAQDKPAQALEWLNQYIGGIDQWHQASLSQIQKKYADMAKADQERIKLQQEAIKSQEDALNLQIEAQQKQIDIIKGWSSLLDTIKKTIIDLRTGITNPQDVFARLSIAKGELDRSMGLYQSSSGADRLKYAGQTSDLLQKYLSVAQEAYQRPSPEYQSIYDSVIGNLEMIQTDAQGYANQEIAIQQNIESLQAAMKGLQEQSNALQQQQVDYSAQMQAEIDALNQEAAKYYEWAKTEGIALYQESIADMKEKLAGILGDKTVEQYLNDLQLAAVAELAQIRDILESIRDTWANAPGHQAGLSYVPYDNYPAILHQGERVLTAAENRGRNERGHSVVIAPQITINNVKDADEKKIASQVINAIEKSAKHGRLREILTT